MIIVGSIVLDDDRLGVVGPDTDWTTRRVIVECPVIVGFTQFNRAPGRPAQYNPRPYGIIRVGKARVVIGFDLTDIDTSVGIAKLRVDVDAITNIIMREPIDDRDGMITSREDLRRGRLPPADSNSVPSILTHLEGANNDVTAARIKIAKEVDPIRALR